jgi:hypothetical protein
MTSPNLLFSETCVDIGDRVRLSRELFDLCERSLIRRCTFYIWLAICWLIAAVAIEYAAPKMWGAQLYALTIALPFLIVGVNGWRKSKEKTAKAILRMVNEGF